MRVFSVKLFFVLEGFVVIIREICVLFDLGRFLYIIAVGFRRSRRPKTIENIVFRRRG